MSKQYFIVDKRILPKHVEKIIQARELYNAHIAKDVSDACKKVGISRSTFYKFKDYVFQIQDESTIRKAILSFNLNHTQGILSNVLHHIAAHQANILTITQNYPIQNNAHVVVMMDIAEMIISIDALILELTGISGVSGIQLISIE